MKRYIEFAYLKKTWFFKEINGCWLLMYQQDLSFMRQITISQETTLCPFHVTWSSQSFIPFFHQLLITEVWICYVLQSVLVIWCLNLVSNIMVLNINFTRQSSISGKYSRDIKIPSLISYRKTMKPSSIFHSGWHTPKKEEKKKKKQNKKLMNYCLS